jgi:hypothetical protein
MFFQPDQTRITQRYCIPKGVKKQLTANMPHYHNRNGGKTTTAVRKRDMAPLKTSNVNQ